MKPPFLQTRSVLTIAIVLTATTLAQPLAAASFLKSTEQGGSTLFGLAIGRVQDEEPVQEQESSPSDRNPATNRQETEPKTTAEAEKEAQQNSADDDLIDSLTEDPDSSSTTDDAPEANSPAPCQPQPSCTSSCVKESCCPCRSSCRSRIRIFRVFRRSCCR